MTASIDVAADPAPSAMPVRFVARRPGETTTSLPVQRSAPEFAELAELIADPSVTDVFVNGPLDVWVDRGDGSERAAALPLDEAGLRALAVRLVALGGRHIDEASPCVDVRLHDGIRVHVVLPPISTGGTLVSIRVPRSTRHSLKSLDESGLFASVALDAIHELVEHRRNVLITGAGGSGKTTLLGAMLAAADPSDRIIAIEDVAELHVDHPHFVSLESRQRNLEGAGDVGLEALVREALRMRPDRLVLGECRGAEVRELFAALNTGHDGGAGTLHANSLEDVPARLEALGALAGLGPWAVARQAVSAFHAVLHLQRRGPTRIISGVGRLVVDDRDRLAIEAV
ncbi:MAG TPA: TadA family conjugal transfer-associated ATPase [Terrimesophilobacter sp.]|nr:TadA family conjugal transfer-associated ATPase [Terrimesophilobacter sp.]